MGLYGDLSEHLDFIESRGRENVVYAEKDSVESVGVVNGAVSGANPLGSIAMSLQLGLCKS